MNKIKQYFMELEKKYHCNITYCFSEISDKQLKKVPVVLHDFYRTIAKAELPFGQIFTVEQAIKESENTPFPPNWFVFGQDNYFSFWLCRYNSDLDGLSFTSWDHESGNTIEIEEATDKDIISFLEYEQEEYQEQEECDNI